MAAVTVTSKFHVVPYLLSTVVDKVCCFDLNKDDCFYF